MTAVGWLIVGLLGATLALLALAVVGNAVWEQHLRRLDRAWWDGYRAGSRGQRELWRETGVADGRARVVQLPRRGEGGDAA